MRQLVANLVHRPQHALEADQLAAQGEQPADFLPFEKGVERALLGLEHLLLDRLDDRQVAVDNEVENGVKHVVDAVPEQPGDDLAADGARNARAPIRGER